MSEKRFILAEDSNGLYSILDTEEKMGELGGFNKHLIKTICGDLE